MEEKKRIIVAVDVPTLKNQALRETLRALAPHVAYFKIGLELIMAGEAEVAMRTIGDPSKIMFDAKLHDIPETVGRTVKRIVARDVGMFTIHASGGRSMIEAAIANKGNSIPLLVTVLTSLDEADTMRECRANPPEQVENLTMLALESGAEAIVCSAVDMPSVHRAEKLMGRRLIKVTPGTRVDWGQKGQQMDDQKRVMTPYEAVEAGADYLVIGRDIMQAEKRHGCTPLQATLRIDEELARFEAAAQIKKQREQQEALMSIFRRNS